DAATPIRTFSITRSGGTWSIAHSDWVGQSQAALPEGDYTVEASQSDGANTGFSPIRNFAVDTTGPSTTIATDTPPNLTNDATPNLHGTAGNAIGDSSTITVDIYSGAAAVGQVKETLHATRSGTGWTLTDGDWASGTPLTPDGQYTAKATQTDSAGNA